ncbi:NusG domain II-containing protein [bacterium]|nr:NusG domain II-containing protein [bacterium]
MEFNHISLKFPRYGDFLIILLILVITVSFFLTGYGKATSKTLCIYYDQEEICSRPLPFSDTLYLKGAEGNMIVGVKGDTVEVLESSCPRKYCQEMGPIYRPREMIVCVPNKIIIIVKGNPSGKKLDGITR